MDPTDGALALFVSYEPPKGRLRFLQRRGLRWTVSNSEDENGNYVYVCERRSGAEQAACAGDPDATMAHSASREGAGASSAAAVPSIGGADGDVEAQDAVVRGRGIVAASARDTSSDGGDDTELYALD